MDSSVRSGGIFFGGVVMDIAEGFNLTEDDVTKLLKDPSGDTRATMASKVAAAFQAEKMSPKARSIAEDIFRVMMRDAETRVRKALSEGLKTNPNVPHDVAMGLAKDVSEVSMPILEFSTVFSDNDLVEIIQKKGAEHQMAIARRQHVSSLVADALVDTNNEDVVATLVSNNGAEITEATMNKVLDEWGHLEKINEPMVKRNTLPINIAERLVSLVSDRLKDHLVTHHQLPPDVAADLIIQSRERATMGLLGTESDKGDVQKLVEQLHLNGRLTATIILRAICTGDLLFFEAALARLAKVPVPNAYILINDRGKRGFRSLYDKAGLPGDMYHLFRAAVEVAREMDYDGRPGDRERFKQRTIERILTQFENEGTMDEQNVEYLVKKLDQIDVGHERLAS